MTRIAIILCVLAAACDVGDASMGQGLKVDGGTGSGKDSAGGGGDAAPLMAHNHCATAGAAECLDQNNPSNAGYSCMQANCHGAVNPAGPKFSYAGTVYTDANATAPAAGIIVHAGTLSGPTDSAGNFYAYSPPDLTFPANTDVTTTTMAEQISTGDCNGSNCHQQKPTRGTQGGIYK